MGGYWSLVFALVYPTRVERIALLGEPAGSNPKRSVLRPREDSRLFSGLVADPARASRALIDCAFAGAMLPGPWQAWRTILELVVAPVNCGWMRWKHRSIDGR